MGRYDDIEKREIKRDGLTAVPNSGRSSRTTNKGDAIMDDTYVVDFKYSEKGVTVNRNMWSKVSTDAQMNGNLRPLLKLILEGDDNSTLRLWVMDDRDFQELRRLVNEST